MFSGNKDAYAIPWRHGHPVLMKPVEFFNNYMTIE
jgi:hypothetical protein